MSYSSPIPDIVYRNLTVSGSLDVAGANFTNINLPNSTQTIGNITKDEERFIINPGTSNTFMGVGSGNLILTGSDNSAYGTGASNQLTSGDQNTALGAFSLASNESGNDNIAVGFNAVANLKSGSKNTIIGAGSLQSSSIGEENTAIGYRALFRNTANNNIAIGSNAGAREPTSSFADCIAIGNESLKDVATGSFVIDIGGGNVHSQGESHCCIMGSDNQISGTAPENCLVAGATNDLVATGVITVATVLGASNGITVSGAIKNVVAMGAANDAETASGDEMNGVALIGFENVIKTSGTADSTITNSTIMGTSNSVIISEAEVDDDQTLDSICVVGNNIEIDSAGGDGALIGDMTVIGNNIDIDMSTSLPGIPLKDCVVIGNNIASDLAFINQNNIIIGSNIQTTGMQLVAITSVENPGNPIVPGSNSISIGYNVRAGPNIIAIGNNLEPGTEGFFVSDGYVKDDVGNATLHFDTGTGQITYAASSARYKENIGDLPDLYDKLLQLSPRKFNHRASPNDESFGFIAEEVESIFPELVGYKDGVPEYLRDYYLFPLLVQAVKKLDAEVKSLRNLLEQKEV